LQNGIKVEFYTIITKYVIL